MISICLLTYEILQKEAAERNSKNTVDKTIELTKTKDTQLADKKTGNDVSDKVRSLND